MINTPDGVFLRVQRVLEPKDDQYDQTLIALKLSVKDNNDPDSPAMELNQIFIRVI